MFADMRELKRKKKINWQVLRMEGTAGVIKANSEKQCTITKNLQCTQVDFEWASYTMNVAN